MTTQNEIPETVATFDNKTNGQTVTVEGEVVDRTKRHDAEWCSEHVTVQTEDGDEFVFVMGGEYNTRRVKHNGSFVGNWTAFLN